MLQIYRLEGGQGGGQVFSRYISGPSILIGRHHSSWPHNTHWEDLIMWLRPASQSVQPSLCCLIFSLSLAGVFYLLNILSVSPPVRVRDHLVVGGPQVPPPSVSLSGGAEFLFWHKVCCCLSELGWFICHNIPLFVIKLEYRQSLQRTTEIRK